jgi:phosphoribosylamine--glycine ligase
VLGVTARGVTIADAVAEAYAAVGHITWPGMQYRQDIGHRAVGRRAEEPRP